LNLIVLNGVYIVSAEQEGAAGIKKKWDASSPAPRVVIVYDSKFSPE
jgi:hypothetical protein